jgi:hypothetical protein
MSVNSTPEIVEHSGDAVGVVALLPGQAPRPQVCQLPDVGLTPTVRAGLATQDGAAWGGEPYPGSYVGVYYTTVAQECPEHCDGIEVSCD